MSNNKTDILIVEDDKIQATLMAQLLFRAGCAVIAVHSGQQAIELALKNKFDIITFPIQDNNQQPVKTTKP
jgi:CheY-like chemotaxis protein